MSRGSNRLTLAALVVCLLLPYGRGKPAVEALLALMDKALAAQATREGSPPSERAPGVPTEPTEDDSLPPVPDQDEERAKEQRTAWIARTLQLTRATKRETRRAAARALVTHDREGDCIDPLLELVPAFEKQKQTEWLIDVMHELGVPDLTRAAPTLHPLL